MDYNAESTKWREKKRILKGYDVFAPGYDELYSEEQDKKYASVSQYLNCIQPPVLDCGCGTGRLLQSSFMRDKTAVGIDYSYNMVSQAKKRLCHLSNIALVQADAEHLPFRDEVFGTVVSFSLFEDLPDWTCPLTEIYRVARKSSLVIISSLKSNFQHQAFSRLCSRLCLAPAYFLASEGLKDYVAVCTKNNPGFPPGPKSFIETKEHQSKSS